MSQNKYGSILRTYVARNLEEAALTSGVDIVVPPAPLLHTVPQFTLDMNKETNFNIDKAGMFSNFADGLVLKDPQYRFDLTLSATPFTLANNPYTLTLTYGSKVVTTFAGSPGWTPGLDYPVAIQESVSGEYTVMYINATGAGTGNLYDYWAYTSGNLLSEALTAFGSRAYVVKNISVLNCMYNVTEFFQPLIFTGGVEYAYVALRVALNLTTSHNTTFMTHTINSAFDGSTVHFDAVIDVEFTGA
jgi:hypothetical protein